jgi:hypothetical protein
MLAGCVPGDPVVTPEPEPDSTPVFASDEEALAAATDAYAKYLEVSDEITADGGTDPERLKPYVTTEQFKDELSSFKDLQSAGTRTQGHSNFEVVQLQQYLDAGDGTASITVYLCVDVTEVRIIDSTGADITPQDRIGRLPLEVEVEVKSGDELDQQVARSTPWSGTDFCG